MTIEELADLDAAALEKLTDEQLDKILKPYYTVTRPELVVRAERKTQQPELTLSPAKRAALAMMQEDGMDLSFLKYKKKK